MKTIIITGGTSGIGLDIANYFYKKNYNVAIAGINGWSIFGDSNKDESDNITLFIVKAGDQLSFSISKHIPPLSLTSQW